MSETPKNRFSQEIMHVVEAFEDDLNQGQLALELLSAATIVLVRDVDTHRRAYELTNEAAGELLMAQEAAT